ncbi:hypothetical protein ANCCEY_14461 [Ancylostoma ceylanicum]|uniref:ABC transmembrane type-1 domain-containing protein n=1 Tax=Ancylostoma ceylanicum TaxID=53326 RepID=A0A0D6L9S8_9BILA|nr:hypothetical protein ANCCEY_14461 [Ancylostoma ceylanicum]
MCFADPRVPIEKTRKSAELDSSFFNRLTLWWFNPIPWKGAQKDLESINFSKDNKEKGPTLPSVVGCLFSMFRWEFLTATALKVTSDVLQFANPFLLHQLIGFVSQEVSPLWIGLSYSILMFAASEVRSFVLNAYFYIMMRMGIKFQTVLTAAVYKKTLKLSNSARRDKTVGEIVNLMAIDVERFQMITPQIQQFWSCPFQIALALTYLFITLGYSAAPGVIIMVIFLPTNIVGSIIVKKWQTLKLSNSARRDKTVGEIVNLMAIDVERFQMITPQIQQFWSCPFQIALALTYLFITLGYSAAPGVIIMVLRKSHTTAFGYPAVSTLRGLIPTAKAGSVTEGACGIFVTTFVRVA